MDLPAELKSPKKRLINTKNKDEKCSLWCHARHNNLSKEHPGRIKNNDKKIGKKLDYDGTEFHVLEKDLNKIEVKMGWFFQFLFQTKNLKTRWICCF